MNRTQRRAFVKKAKEKGVKESVAKAYADIISKGTGEHTPSQAILEGQSVKLNISEIQKRQNYDSMSPLYKEFVENNADRVFTAHIDKGKNLISFVEQPEWLFWSGDLIICDTETTAEE